jgi:hypothetical protein
MAIYISIINQIIGNKQVSLGSSQLINNRKQSFSRNSLINFTLKKRRSSTPVLMFIPIKSYNMQKPVKFL